MAEGVGFPFPSLPLNEGRTYGQPEVVLISLLLFCKLNDAPVVTLNDAITV